MKNRGELALALLLLSLGLFRGWEAVHHWQTGEIWGLEAASSLLCLSGVGLVWRGSRDRA